MIFCGHILQTVYIQGNIYRKYVIRQDMHNVVKKYSSFVSIPMKVSSLSPHTLKYRLPFFFYLSILLIVIMIIVIRTCASVFWVEENRIYYE